MRRILSAVCAAGLLYACGSDREKLVDAPLPNMLSPFGLTASKGLAEHVRLDWSMPEETQPRSFRIERDGVEIAVVASNRTSFLDTSADGGLVETPRPPVIRSERDRVAIEWSAPDTREGGNHSYTVIADYVGVERRAESAVGNPGAPEITGYAVRRDGALLATLPPTSSSYDDLALAPGAAEPPIGLKVKPGEGSVSLSWSQPGVHPGVSYLYTVEALSEVGTTAASNGRRGARLAGEILGYLIERDGRPIASVPANALSYDDAGAIAGTLAPSAAFSAKAEDEGIRLEWSSAAALPGFEHTYGVMAVTADSVGLPATTTGYRSAPAVTGYRVMRDGILVATLPPTASSFVDTGAAAGILGAPTALTLALSASGTTLAWSPPAGSQGGTYRYELVAATDLGQATASSIATASRGAPAVAEYHVLRDGSEIARLPPSVTTYEDRGAASQLDPPVLSLAPSADAVDLSWQPPSSVGSSFHTWQVVAVRGDGQRSGPASASGSSASSVSQYIVTRDGVEIAFLPPGASTFRDTGALPGTIDQPLLELRSSAESVTLRWDAPAVHAGPTHAYRVKAITGVGTTVSSLELPAARTAPSITGYRIDRDWMPLVSLSAAQRSYDDTSASAGSVTAAELLVTTTVDSVGLSWQAAATTAGQARSYELYALAGSSAIASPEMVGGRTNPAVSGYRLFRDGASIASLPPTVLTFDDAAAAPGTIDAMGPVTLNAGVGSIELRWQAPATNPGTTHVYTLDTQIDSGAVKTSAPKSGQRVAPALSAFRIARDGAALATLPATATSYDDLTASAGSFVGTLALALQPRVDAIRLDWTPPVPQGGSAHAYSVQPIAGAVSGTASSPVSAARVAPAISAYTVTRDGVSIASLPAGVTSHEDAASAAGSVDAPSGLAAIGGVDSVQLDWLAAVSHAGTTHAYAVIAANDLGPDLASETTPAARLAPAVLGYRVQRDGSEIAATAGTSWTDTGATAGVLHEPTGVVASQGTRPDGVSVTWAAAATDAGTLHHYAVIADTDLGPTAPSSTAQAGRLDPVIVRYEVSRDSGSWMTAGLGTSYDDTSAPYGAISAAATAEPNDVLSFVELGLVAPPAYAASGPSTYEVRAVTASGPGPVSVAATGFRGGGPVPGLTFQWQRSAADSDAGYADLAGATDPATIDKTNPLDQGRYYRIAYTGSGVSGFSTPARAMALSYSNVSAGARHTCGVRSDGSARCWGATADGRATVPAGIQLVTIAAGGRHTCGMRTDRRIQCWGHNGDRQLNAPNLDQFQSVSAGDAHTCGVRRSGRDMECWGNDGSNRASPPWFTDWRAVVSAGGRHTCAIDDNDRAECWGSNSDNQTRIPSNLGRIVDITAGDEHSCAVQQGTGALSCWGNNAYGQTNRPTGAFLRVTAGTRHTCALRTNNSVACWGSSADNRLAVPAGTYKAVSAGADHTCGIHTDGRIDCWGRNTDGQAPQQP